MGTSSVSLVGELDGGGVANPTQFVKKGSWSSCFCAASVISGHGPVADVDAVESRERVEVAVALVVPDVAALAALDHELRRARPE